MKNGELRVGIPCEIMPHEGRVPVLPETMPKIIKTMRRRELRFVVQTGVGKAIGICDNDWRKNGAVVTMDRGLLYRNADIILKVKQPFINEVPYYREEQGSFCFHHVVSNRSVVEALLKKAVNIIPFEFHRPTLAAMSREAGRRVAIILETWYGSCWRSENIFVGGAGGVAGQNSIATLRQAGVPATQIYACDLFRGAFTSSETGYTYEVFPSTDEETLTQALFRCRIFILAAVNKVVGAPKFLKLRHLVVIPDNSFFIQIAIDEGGNIDDTAFTRLTYGDNPVYETKSQSLLKRFRVFNVPDIPGCIDPKVSSIALDQANFDYYCEIFDSFPAVSPKYLFMSFP